MTIDNAIFRVTCPLVQVVKKHHPFRKDPHLGISVPTEHFPEN
jgi:hypothetical protein